MNLEHWPLRRLNLLAIPIAILLAIRGGGFWWSLGASAIVAGVAAHLLATLWIGRLRAELRRTERANPLQHLYQARIQGLADPSLRIRFVFMQALSGALIGAMWFAIAAGVVALVTRFK